MVTNAEKSAFEKEWSKNDRMLILGILGIIVSSCIGVLLGILLG